MASEYDGGTNEESLSQRDLLALSADIHLGAVDLAEALAVTGDRQKSAYELTIYREQLPVHAVPGCWHDIGEQLESVVIEYRGLAGDERFDLELRAYFDRGWSSVLSKPALTGNERPFNGDTTRSVNRSGTQRVVKRYQTEASYEEVTGFLSALIHDMRYQDEQAPLSDPMDAAQARTVVDTIEQSVDADVVRIETYLVENGGERYLIDCESSDGRVSTVDICQVLADDIVIEHGELKQLYHYLICQITLGNFEQGIRFHVDSEDGFLSEEDVNDDMLVGIKQTIDMLNEWLERPGMSPMDADSETEAARRHRWQERYGAYSPDIDPLDEDGLDAPDAG